MVHVPCYLAKGIRIQLFSYFRHGESETWAEEQIVRLVFNVYSNILGLKTSGCTSKFRIFGHL